MVMYLEYLGKSRLERNVFPALPAFNDVCVRGS